MPLYWHVIIKKLKGCLEACLMADRGGVIQTKSVLAGHTPLHKSAL